VTRPPYGPSPSNTTIKKTNKMLRFPSALPMKIPGGTSVPHGEPKNMSPSEVSVAGRAEWIAARAGDLPVLPQVATRVLELVSDSEVRNRELEGALSCDPSLTARVLKISNSALYAQRGAVSTLGRAISVLGLNTLRSVVIAASTKSLYRTKSPRFQERILWDHSVAAALAARLIAREVRYAGVEEAFTAGLLHDIGKVVLDQNLGVEYHTVLERVYNEGDAFADAERDVLGFDHAEVGAIVVQKWNLASHLQDAVQYHHRVPEAEKNAQLCAIISLGNAMCVKRGIGPERRPDLDLEADGSADWLDLEPGEMEHLGDRLVESFEEAKSAFGLD
jgi:putative nucleotidyltransferase with HDIG domain